jgi:RNA-directed DNA polymerase
LIEVFILSLSDFSKCSNLVDLADNLLIAPKKLSYILYKLSDNKKYSSFTIKKKSGDSRHIHAPTDSLKVVQKILSKKLNQCLEDIEKTRFKNTSPSIPRICSHGFRKKFIFDKNENLLGIHSNAKLHRNKRFVFNIDLEDFFPSFNFGRVRGYFIKNDFFCLDPKVATIIAQIACFENKLPQGSPCSPVISNLICQSLDHKLAELALKNGCIYSRYADDITFSTNKNEFPLSIADKSIDVNGKQLWLPGKSLKKIINKSGFNINAKKISMQYEGSRQIVTGLIVNKKVNVKREYYKQVRALCNSLFLKGYCEINNYKCTNKDLKKIDGTLNYIYTTEIFSNYQKFYKEKSEIKINSSSNDIKLTSKQKLYSKFLFYKYFIGNESSTILCEGKTDILHLQCANNKFLKYKKYSIPKRYYLKFSKKNFDLAILKSSGAGELRSQMGSFFEKHKFSTVLGSSPVIFFMDYDEEAEITISAITKTDKNKKNSNKNEFNVSKNINQFNRNGIESELRSKHWIFLKENIYFAITPRVNSQIEDFYEKDFLDNFTKGKKLFSGYDPKFDPVIHLSKNDFADHVKQNIDHINFNGFVDIFKVFNEIEEDYKERKL